MNVFDNKNVFVTGGTGSFGSRFVDYLLKNTDVNKVVVFSRDEIKQWDMGLRISDPRVRFRLGDVRDQERLNMAMSDCDMVVHAAATKIVPIAERDPIEAIKTNIIGATNVIKSALNCNISQTVALSTDKASSPINLYGATKLVSDRLFSAASGYESDKAKFSVVRYGNVMGSRGSIIPFLRSLSNGVPSPLTDARMTRFMITLDEAIALVEKAFLEMHGGEIFVPKIPSMKVVDLINTLRPSEEVNVVGIRPGEKIHEQMISEDESSLVYEYPDHYRIIPSFSDPSPWEDTSSGRVADDFCYTSANNKQWMSPADLLGWVEENDI